MTPLTLCRRAVHLLLALALTLLAACGDQVVLQSGLNDTDANEMMTVLRHAGIASSKSRLKDGISMSVAADDLPRATELVKAAGLPRRQLSLLGDVFKKDGMISTPLEERARYLHGLSQELEFTLSRIDRVVVARVHVVLPERVAPGEPVKPSSASVFIKYQAPIDEDLLLPRIRRLVLTSIPGLAEDAEGRKLSVVMLPVAAPEVTVEWVQFGPFRMMRESAEKARQWLLIGTALVVVTALVGGAVLVWRVPALRRRVLRKPAPEAA